MIVGLPHDVVVWSIILHLVRREVWILSKRRLLAGQLSFIVGNNAAHVYKVNEDNFKELLQREPFENCQPYLDLESAGERGMFDLARNYESCTFLIRDYADNVKHGKMDVNVAVE